MKKIILFVVIISISNSVAIAQTMCNKLSIEGDFGFNKPYKNINPGHYTNDINFLTGNLGVRYMWSEYLGAKIDYGYNSFSNHNKSKQFESVYSRVDMQLVTNLGRILNLQEKTKNIGLFLHAGGGVGFIDSNLYDKSDGTINLIGGTTLQFRLSNRIALNLDGAAIFLIEKVDYTLDGTSYATKNGYILSGTMGLSIYLGKNKKHSDWYNFKLDRTRRMSRNKVWRYRH